MAFIGDITVLSFIQITERYASSIKFFFYLIQYANFVPLSIYFTLDIIDIVHFYKSSTSYDIGTRKHFIIPYNPTVFANLGTIDYAVIDSTALTCDNPLKVQQIFLSGVFYSFRRSDLNDKLSVQLETELLSPTSTKFSDDLTHHNFKKSARDFVRIYEEGNNHDAPIQEEDSKESQDSKDSEDKDIVDLNAISPDISPRKGDEGSMMIISLKQAMKSRQDSEQTAMIGLETEVMDTERDQRVSTNTQAILPASIGYLSDRRGYLVGQEEKSPDILISQKTTIDNLEKRFLEEEEVSL